MWIPKGVGGQNNKSFADVIYGWSHRALVMILSQPEIKAKVEGAIDMKKSNYLGFVNLKED